ncbi:UvrD-helicase domain-containing protein [candidate division KSB1 bacterium]|nr:UvrD-helicase domain-containing protein [candidate division KSB1 bacterium]
MTVNIKRSDLQWIYSDLNDAQQKAVCFIEGPVLVLAGAGSGKTRVLTYRIAYILAKNFATPKDILAMTFTNKAAGEMKDRVAKLVPNMAGGMWIGTFHSLFARLLRREGEKLGYTSNFTIYDEDDKVALIKMIIKDLGWGKTDLSPKRVAHVISRAKNDLFTPMDLAKRAESVEDEMISQIYVELVKRLKDSNAMDFDDLLIKPIELFQKYPLVKEYYQDRFKYILVDEYQDTNRAQYLVLRTLAAKHRNICVVGDDDQSIYRWRGAELRNILEFESDFKKCKKFRLEQNYRSGQNILSAAHSVVSNNTERHPKKLWTEKPPGELVTVLQAFDEREEAQYVVDRISFEMKEKGYRFYDFCVLYRTNAQSRVLEDALRSDGLPYIIVGGVKFYERKEIKDILAYLRLLVNPADSISLRRVINFPARGIGDTTVARIENFARNNKISLFEAVKRVTEIPELGRKTLENVYGFYQLIQKYTNLMKELTIAELTSSLIEDIGIIRMYARDETPESFARADNIRELVNAIAQFYNQNENTGLEFFLQHVSLAVDIDNLDDKTNAITLMTLHSAKGLEYSVVFMTGLEEGLFPISRSMAERAALEEERRLFYVGATRAKEKLYLTWAKSRYRFNDNSSNIKSRFLKELDGKYVLEQQSRIFNIQNRKQQTIWDEPSYIPAYEDESQETGQLCVGARVRHPIFGKGNILRIEKMSGNIKVTVLFDRVGEKRLVLPYAKLEIL